MSSACIVIKSGGFPVGYTEIVAGKYPDLKSLFSPEFLREGVLFTTTCIPRIVSRHPISQSGVARPSGNVRPSVKEEGH